MLALVHVQRVDVPEREPEVDEVQRVRLGQELRREHAHRVPPHRREAQRDPRPSPPRAHRHGGRSPHDRGPDGQPRPSVTHLSRRPRRARVPDRERAHPLKHALLGRGDEALDLLANLPAIPHHLPGALLGRVLVGDDSGDARSSEQRAGSSLGLKPVLRLARPGADQAGDDAQRARELVRLKSHGASSSASW